MREHIQRQAMQSIDAAGWLVPIALATAAFAAVALGTSVADEAQPHAVAAVPPVAPAPAAADKPQAEESAAAAEHVQAF